MTEPKLSQEGTSSYDNLVLEEKIRFKKNEITYLYTYLEEAKKKYGFNSERAVKIRETIAEDEAALDKLLAMRSLV